MRIQEQSTSTPETVVGSSLRVDGELTSQGDIRIDGEVRGTIKTQGNVTIGSGATVTANIEAASAEIAGQVTGDVTVKDKVTLAQTARHKGNVTCAKLVIHEGAVFSGTSHMSNEQSKPSLKVPNSLKSKAPALT
jgi:cytoskeletal protein CcmA (bactofilin family)